MLPKDIHIYIYMREQETSSVDPASFLALHDYMIHLPGLCFHLFRLLLIHECIRDEAFTAYAF